MLTVGSKDIAEALATNPDSLTPAEREVADLLAQYEYAIATMRDQVRLKALATAILGEDMVQSEFGRHCTEQWKALNRLQVDVQQRVLTRLGFGSADFAGIEILVRP